MIQPTVGRIVLFHAYATDTYPGAKEGPQAAIVTKVWSDTCVNLCVFDANGNVMSKTSVLLVQPNSESPGAGYCTWMPYQVGQAAKTDQLEKQLASKQPVAS